MRTFFNFFVLALIVVDGGYSIPTPGPALDNDVIADHAIKAAQDAARKWDLNHHYSKRSVAKRFDWGGALNIAGKVAGGILGSFFKRSEVLPGVQLDKRTLPSVESQQHSEEKRTLSFLRKLKGTNNVHAKRDTVIQGHEISKNDALKMGVVVAASAEKIDDEGNVIQDISNEGNRAAGVYNPEADGNDAEYINAVKGASEINAKHNIKAQQSIVQGETRKVRRGEYETDSTTTENVSNDMGTVQKAIQSASAQIVQDQNDGQTIAPLEVQRQTAQVASLLAKTVQNQINQATTDSSEPEGEAPSSTSTASATATEKLSFATAMSTSSSQ